ncbi:MAG: hypothetical protein IKW90_04605 [Lachnospiraceae bacterium]|nr:hypothetical protein [Lachnospiraceae bacterium]
MKVYDFLRMKITPNVPQFNQIKTIKFFDDSNSVIIGEGASSVYAFCIEFFDVVRKEFSSSKGAIHLIDANNSGLFKLSGCDCLILIQKILSEIKNSYSLDNYNITCEVNDNAGKTENTRNSKLGTKSIDNATQSYRSIITELNLYSFFKNEPRYVEVLSSIYPGDEKIYDYLDALMYYSLGNEKSANVVFMKLGGYRE